MNAPKRPQDRKPKTPKAKKPTVADIDGGKLVTFPDILTSDEEPLTVTVTFEALDDFELLEEMHALEVKKNAAMLPSVFRRFVGDDYARVMDALREPSGRVKIARASQFLKELIGALNPKS